MCGITGVYLFDGEDSPELVALSLFSQQHRGQESCGISYTDGKRVYLKKGMGLVKDVFATEVLSDLQGRIGIGHVRYPTRGSSENHNSQPHIVETLFGPAYALASNGDIVNYNAIKEDLLSKGVFFKSSNDGELILRFLVYKIEMEKKSVIESITELMKEVRGAFSTVLLMRDTLYLFRDPFGYRPMSFAELSDGDFAVASETCALDILNPKYTKEVAPGQIVVVNKKGIEFFNDNITKNHQHCIFEHIYFSRPDSVVFGESVYEIRKKSVENWLNATKI